MKLHLPKSLRAALLACLAAIAPVATTVATSSMIAGTFALTVAPNTALGTDYYMNDYASAVNTSYSFYTAATEDGNGSAVAWESALSSNSVLVFATDAQYLAAVGVEKTGNGVTDYNIASGGSSIGGITVMDGVTGYSYGNSSSSYPRASTLYAADSSDSAEFTIYEDFLYYNACTSSSSGYNSLYLSVDANINLYDDATFTMQNWVLSVSGDVDATVNITGSGTFAYTFTLSSTLSQLSYGLTQNDWVVGKGATFDLSANDAAYLTSILGTGTLTLDGGTLNLMSSANLGSTLAVTSNGGTITTGDGNLTLSGVIALSSGAGTIDMDDAAVTLASGITLDFDSDWESGTYTLLTDVSSVTGLDTELTITGVSVGTSVAWLYDEDADTLSFVYTVSDIEFLTWSTGGALSLAEDATGFDNEGTFNSGDALVIASADVDIVLTGSVTVPYLSVADGLTASLSEGDNELSLSAVALGDGSTLTIKDDVLSSSTSFTACSSSSIVNIDANGAELSYGEALSSFTGMLKVTSADLDLSNSANSLSLSSLTIEAGSSVDLGSTSPSCTISMTGSDDASVSTTLSTSGSSISALNVMGGTVTLDIDSSTTLSAVAGSGTLVKTGSGTLTLSGTSYNTGTLQVKEGTFAFGASQTSTDEIGFSTVILESGTTMYVEHAGTSTAFDLVLNGGTVSNYDGSVTSDILIGEMTVSAASSFAYTWGINYDISKLTGSADLSIGGGYEACTMNIGAIEDYNGTLAAGSSYTGVIIGAVSAAEGISTVITGTVSSSSLSMTGAGSLSIETLNLTGGTMDMSVTGSASITSLNVTGSSTLVYDLSLDSLFDISAITLSSGVSLTIDTTDITEDQLATGFSLGLSTTDITDSSVFLLDGYESYQYDITDVDGSWYVALSALDTSELVWAGGDGTWSNADEWLSGDASASFVDGNKVTIGTTEDTEGGTITISSDVKPTSLTFEGAASWTLVATNDATLSLYDGITMNGTGVVDFDVDITEAVSITVNSGTLDMTGDLVSGVDIAVTGGSLTLESFSVTGDLTVTGGSLTIHDYVDVDGSLTVSGGTTNIDSANQLWYLTASGDASLTIGGIDEAYLVNVSDTASVTITDALTGYPDSSGALLYITVTGGTLDLQGGSEYIATLSVTGGTVTIGDYEGEGGVTTIGSITSDGGSIVFKGDTVINSFNAFDGTGILNIVLADGVTVTDNGGASESSSTQVTRVQYLGNSASIVVGEDALYTADVKWWTKGSTFDISGGGTVQLTSMLLDCTSSNTTMTIGEGTTLEILTAGASKGTAVGLGLSGSSSGYSTSNIDGTLIVNGSIYSYSTSGSPVVNVSSTGTMQMNDGIFAETSSSAILMNVSGTLSVGNQASASDYSSALVVTMADGATLTDNGVAETTTVYTSLTYADDATVNFASTADGALAIATAVTGTNVSANISGNVTLAGTTSLSAVTVAADSTLNISGAYSFNSAITGAGTVSILDGASLDITGLTLVETAGDSSTTYSYTLVDGATLVLADETSIFDYLNDASTALLSSDYDWTYADGVISYGSVIESITYTIDGITDYVDSEGTTKSDLYVLFSVATANDKVIMNMVDTDDYTSSKFWADEGDLNSDYTCDAGEIEIVSWYMDNGSTTKSWTFNSTITGDGDIEFVAWSTSSGATNDNLFTFTGDMSAWTGDIIAVANSSGAYVLSVAITGTDSTAASGTGSITIEGPAEYLEYSFTGETTIANKAITVSNLNLKGGGDYSVTNGVTVSGTTSIAADTDLSLGGTSSIADLSMGSGSSLEVSADSTLTLSGAYSFSDDTSIVNNGTITLIDGVVFDITDVTFAENEDGDYSAVLIGGEGTINLGDLALTDIFTSASLAGLSSYSFEDGVFTYSELSGWLYTGGTLDLGIGTEVNDVAYANDLGLTFSTADASVNLTDDLAPEFITIKGGITVDISSTDGSTLSSSTIKIGSGSNLSLDYEVIGSTMDFSASAADSTLTLVIGEGETYTTASNIQTFTGDLVITGGGSFVTDASWISNTVYPYNFASVTLEGTSSMTLSRYTMGDVSFANSSAESTISMWANYTASISTYDTVLSGYKGNLVITNGQYSFSSAVDYVFSSLTVTATGTEEYGQFLCNGATISDADTDCTIKLNGCSDQTAYFIAYAGATVYADFVIDTNGTLDLQSGYTVTVYGDITDSSADDTTYKTGAGALVVNGSIDVDGSFTVSAGTVTLGDMTLSAGSVTGTLSANSLTDATLSSVTMEATSDVTLSGSVSLTSTSVTGGSMLVGTGSTLSLDSDSSVASITLSGGTVSTAGTLSSALVVGTDGGSLSSSTSALVLDCNISYSGDVTAISLSGMTVSLGDGFSIVLGDSITSDGMVIFTDVVASDELLTSLNALSESYDWSIDGSSLSVALVGDVVVDAAYWNPESGLLEGGTGDYASTDFTIDTDLATTALLNTGDGVSINDLAISGDNSLIIQGTGALVAGDITIASDVTATAAVQADSVTVTGADVDLAGGGSLASATVGSGASLTLSSAVSVSDSITLDSGSLTLAASSVEDGEGATVSTTEDYTLTGTGTVTTADYDGSLTIASGATAVTLNANNSGRYDLTLDGDVNVQQSSDAGTTQLYLGNLSGTGDINVTGSTYYHVGVNVLMSQDNVWSGELNHGSTTLVASMTIDSDGDSTYTMTMSQGMVDEAGNPSHSQLNIENAIVKFTDDATWSSRINFNTENSTLILAGNDITFAVGTGSENPDYVNEFYSSATGYGTVEVAMDDDKTATINRANSSYSGDFVVTSGTLSVTNADALGTVGTVAVNGGTLSLGVALTASDITLNGGTILAATGTLSENITVTATSSLAGVDGALTLNSTISYADAFYSLDLSGDSVSLGSSFSLDLSDLSMTTVDASYTIFTGVGNDISENLESYISSFYDTSGDYSYSLSYVEDDIILSISAVVVEPQDLVWDGGSGDWTTADEWLNGDTAATFAAGDSVTIGSTSEEASSYTITVGSDLSMGSLAFVGSDSYTIDASDYSIDVTGALTATGTGSSDIVGDVTAASVTVGDGETATNFSIAGDVNSSSHLLSYANSSLTIDGAFTGDTNVSVIDAIGGITINGVTSGINYLYAETGGTINLAGGIQDSTTSAQLAGGTITFGADSTIASIDVMLDADTNTIVVADGVTVTVNGGNDSDNSVYNRRNSYGYTISLGAGSILDDNVSLWMSNSPVTIEGSGTYIVDNVIVGSSSSFSQDLVLTVGAGATMVVEGTTTSTGATSSFILGGGSGVTSIADVYGTLELNSGIGVCTGGAASSTLNVYEGATLIMHAGLIAESLGGAVDINLYSGTSLVLGTAALTENDYTAGDLNVNLYDDTTITTDGSTDVAVYTTITLVDDATVSVTANEGETIKLYGGVVSEAGSTIAITGAGVVAVGSDGYTANNDWEVSNSTIDFSSNADADTLAAAMGTGAVCLDNSTLVLADAATVNSSIAVATNSVISVVADDSASLTLNGLFIYDGSAVAALSLSYASVTLGDDYSLSIVGGIDGGNYTILTNALDITEEMLTDIAIAGLSDAQEATWTYKNGTLTLAITGDGLQTIVWDGGSGVWTDADEWLNGDTAATFAAGDYVTIGTDADVEGTSSTITLDGDVKVTDLAFVGDATWTLSPAEAETLTVTGELSKEDGGSVTIAATLASANSVFMGGGSLSLSIDESSSIGSIEVEAGSLLINASSDENGNGASLGSITVNGGELTVDGDVDSIAGLSVTGGALNLDSLDSVNGELNLTGGTTTIGHADTLSDFAVSGEAVVTIGSIDVISSMSVSNTASLTVTGSIDIEDGSSLSITVSGGALDLQCGADSIGTMTVSGGSATIGDYADGDTTIDSLTMSGGTLSLNGDTSITSWSNMNASTVETIILGEGVRVTASSTSDLYMRGDNITLGVDSAISFGDRICLAGDTTTISGEGTVTMGRLLLNGQSGNGDSTLDITGGASVIVTSSDTLSTIAGGLELGCAADLTGTINIGGEEGAGTLSINSGISANNASSTGIINIYDNGTMILNNGFVATGSGSITLNVDGLMVVGNQTDTTDYSGAMTVNLNDGATIEAGAEGTTTVYHSFVYEDGATINFTAGEGNELVMTSAVTADANVSGTVGFSTLTLTDSLVNTGTVNLSGALTATGDSVTIANSGTINIGVDGSITVAEGQSMSLNGIIALSAAEQIVNNGTLTVANDIVFDLAAISSDAWVLDEEAGVYSLCLISGNAVDLSSLSIEDNLTGLTLSDYDKLAFGDDGNLTYDAGLPTELVWAGGDSGTWSDGGIGWSDDDSFANGDTVTFDASSEVTTVAIDAAGVSVASLIVTGDVSYTIGTDGEGTVDLSKSLTVADGASASFGVAVNFDESATITVGEGSSLALYGNSMYTALTVASLDNSGSLATMADLTVNSSVTNGGTLSAGSVTINGDANFTSLGAYYGATINGDAEVGTLTSYAGVTITGSLTMGDASSVTGTVSAASLTTSGTVSVGELSTNSLTNTGDLTVTGSETINLLYGFDSTGSVTATNASMNIFGAVANGGTLEAANVALYGDSSFTKLTVAGTVTTAATLSLGDGSSIGTLAGAYSMDTFSNVGASLTTSGSVEIGKVDESGLSSLSNSGTLSIGSDVAVTGTFTNMGTVTVDGDLSLSAGTYSGGVVSVDDLTIAGTTGMSMFSGITASGTVTADHTIYLTDSTQSNSIGAWAGNGGVMIYEGVSLSIGSDATFVGMFYNGGELDMAGYDLSLEATTGAGGTVTVGDITLAGGDSFTSITASGALTTAGTLTTGSLSVGSSAMSLGGALSITGDLSANNSLTSLAVAVNYALSGSAVITAASIDSSITSIDLSFSDDLASLTSLGLKDGSTYTLVDLDTAYTGDVTIGGLSVEDFSLELSNTAIITLTTDADGNIALLYSIESIIMDDGTVWNESTTTKGEVVTLEKGSVEVSGAQEAGELQVGGGASVELGTYESASVAVAGNLGVSDASSLTISVDEVVSDSVTIAGDSSVLVAEGTLLETDSMKVESGSVFSNEGETSIANVADGSEGSIVNSGTLAIAGGTLSGELDNSGNLTMSGRTYVETLTGSGTTTLSNGIIYIGEVSDSATLNVADGELVNYSGDTTLGTLNLGSDSGMAITGESTISNLYLAADSTLAIDADSTVYSLSGSGLVSVGGDLNVASVLGSSSSVEATGTLSIENNGSLLSVAAAYLITDSAEIANLSANGIMLTSLVQVENSAANGISLMSLSFEESPDYVLDLGSLSSYDGGDVITLSLSALDEKTAEGTYYLIDGCTWSDFELDSATTDMISKLVNDYNMDVVMTTSNGSDTVLVLETASDRAWSTSTNYVSSELCDSEELACIKPVYDETTGILSSVDVLDTVEQVNVDADLDLSLSCLVGEVTLNDLKGVAGATLTITGDAGASVELYNDSTTVANNTLVADALALSVATDGVGSLSLADLDLTNGSTLTVEDTADLTVTSLMLDATSTLTGAVALSTGESTLAGSYTDASITLTNGATATLASDSAGLTVYGSNGTLNLNSDYSVGTVALTGADVVVSTSNSTSVTLTADMSMVGGTLSISLSSASIGDASYTVFTGANLSLTDTTIIVSQSDSGASLDLTNNTSYELFTLTDGALDLDGVSFELEGDVFGKYMSDVTVDTTTGIVSATYFVAADFYTKMAETDNGAAGLNLVSSAFTASATSTGDLADVVTSLDSYSASGNYAAADKLGAAVAGATTTSLGSALMSDIERQLRTVRNRTKAMGVGSCITSDETPGVSAWMSAEAGSSQLSADGTRAGHSFNTYGGSVGMELDMDDAVSFGIAYSALYGNLNSDGADTAEGDLDTMYTSVYTRVKHNNWSHSFLVSYGTADAQLDRTVSTSNGYYKTHGDTEGTAFGMMYEASGCYALNEEKSTILQPIFNVSLVKTSMDGYTETESDAALIVGDQDNTYATFGLGAGIETIVGEGAFNRASVLSARALLKVDAGDRTSEADVSLVNNAGVTETVKGAKVGAVGIELGAGITVPVMEETGALFMDFSCELRSGYTNVNGSVGYRFSF